MSQNEPKYTCTPSMKPSSACMCTVIFQYTRFNAKQVDQWMLLAEQTSIATPPSPFCMLKSKQECMRRSVCLYATNNVLIQLAVGQVQNGYVCTLERIWQSLCVPRWFRYMIHQLLTQRTATGYTVDIFSTFFCCRLWRCTVLLNKPTASKNKRVGKAWVTG